MTSFNFDFAPTYDLQPLEPIEYRPIQRGDLLSSNDLDGSSWGDDLFGGWMNDTVDGFAGDDFISGSYGDDVLSGGDGDDSLEGGHGRDNLNGGAGDDSLEGGDGDDYLFDDAGTNQLFGGAGADVLDFAFGEGHGGAGDDRVTVTRTGSAFGGAGDDVLESWRPYAEDGRADGVFAQTLAGGAGEDVFNVYVRSDWAGTGDDWLVTTIADYEPGERVYVEGMDHAGGGTPAQDWDSDGDGFLDADDRGTLLNGNGDLVLYGADNMLLFEGVSSIDAADVLFLG